MADRKLFANSVKPLPAVAGITPKGLMVNLAQPEHDSEPMTLLFSLAIPDDARKALEAAVERGETVPLDELREKYSPKEADLDALTSWLKDQGYKIVDVASDRTGVYARASVDQIRQSLAVNMVRVTKDGVTYNAAQDAPSLPAEVGAGVHAIVGLQPFRKGNKNSRSAAALRQQNRSSLAPDGTLSPNVANQPPYLVRELLKAYGADGIAFTGEGQTVAILIDTFPNDDDLVAFWKANGLAISLAQIEKVNVNESVLPPPEGEETLDTEWASGVAPRAKIRIYATASLGWVDLNRALDKIIADLPAQHGLNQLSISLGLGETYMASDEVAAQHQRFLTLAAAGVNVFVSSGDAGSNPDVTGQNSSGPVQVEYESSDSAVIGVGGTSLFLAADGEVAREDAWTGSGGGVSVLFATRPAWQKAPGMGAGAGRLVPDVSAAADPNTGAFLVLNGVPVGMGGTSWSAPMWAGFCALINEARGKAGKPPLPFLNPLLYAQAGTACFRDIGFGNNGAYDAGAGYDSITGLGVPNIKALIAALTK
jgi:kumamolisin